jgi:endonuclease YncB( thermonuclease family)
MRVIGSWQYWAGVMTAFALMSAAIVIGSNFAQTSARDTVPAAGARFTCTPTQVWDGDGPIWCAEGPRIRLAGIAAREIDGVCREGHPCPASSGVAARDHLVMMLGGPRGRASTGHIIVRGPRLSCLSDGQARGKRTAAWCVAPAPVGDLSCAMVKSGHAVDWKRYGGDRVCRR